MIRAVTALGAACLYVATPALARPVSYPGGWTFIEETDRQTTALWVHYTLTPKWSVGGRSEWDRQEDRLFSGVQDTSLAAGCIGALADWETRRLFTSYRLRYLDTDGPGDEFVQAARVGFAPYEGDTGDLHTWLMIEVDHRPNYDEEIGVTPLLRFFKGAALLEVGWSITDDEPLANFTYRF